MAGIMGSAVGTISRDTCSRYISSFRVQQEHESRDSPKSFVISFIYIIHIKGLFLVISVTRIYNNHQVVSHVPETTRVRGMVHTGDDIIRFQYIVL